MSTLGLLTASARRARDYAQECEILGYLLAIVGAVLIAGALAVSAYAQLVATFGDPL